MKVRKRRVENSLVITLIVAIIVLTIHDLSMEQLVVAGEPQRIDCRVCHSIVMERHQFPTSICNSCHSSDMTTLTLKGGKMIPIEESDPLCAQCHKEIFQTWIEGKHGISYFKCVECHDPHSKDKIARADTMAPNMEELSSLSVLLLIICAAGVVLAVFLIGQISDRI
jgi:hypothetical protein